MVDTVQAIIDSAAAHATAPGIAFAASRGNGRTYRWFAGHHNHRTGAPAVTTETIFDLASLTKPLSTTLWCFRLLEENRLQLDTPIGSVLNIAHEALAQTPIWRLMNHTTGLRAHHRFYEEIGPKVKRDSDFAFGAQFIRRAVLNATPESLAGESEIYSDIGYLTLELICESVDRPLREAWHTLPGHGGDALHFSPITTSEPQVETYASTEECPWRDVLLTGEVHDDNCWTMGGIAGHAGLFGTLDAVHNAGQSWLRALTESSGELGLSAALVQDCLDRKWMHAEGSRVLGWDTPSPGGSTSGQFFGPRSFGHLGFTGTSLWIDPETEVVMTLLTNRVCPRRDNWGIRKLRPALHDAAWNFLEDAKVSE